MQDQYSRTQLLLGKEAMETLHHSRVAVFGIGGVGGLIRFSSYTIKQARQKINHFLPGSHICYCSRVAQTAHISLQQMCS